MQRRTKVSSFITDATDAKQRVKDYLPDLVQLAEITLSEWSVLCVTGLSRGVTDSLTVLAAAERRGGCPVDGIVVGGQAQQVGVQTVMRAAWRHPGRGPIDADPATTPQRPHDGKSSV